MSLHKVLAVIPAREGSKGIPGKNSKKLCGKPLINYTIDYVKSVFDSEDICLSTDSVEIIKISEQLGLNVPFVRPANLATDAIGTFEVIVHALNFYKSRGKDYEAVALFQPTSPFRLKKHYFECINLFNDSVDRIISVVKTKSNPYYLLFEEDERGFLNKSKTGHFSTRQQAPDVYEINGSIYIFNVKSLMKYTSFADFTRTKKYLMDDIYSSDIDTITEWNYAEFLLQNKLIAFD